MFKNKEFEKCGCGKDAVYLLGTTDDGKFIVACNKYSRCPSYQDLKKANKDLKSYLSKIEEILSEPKSNKYKFKFIKRVIEKADPSDKNMYIDINKKVKEIKDVT